MIVLKEYDPTWPDEYERERVVIERALTPYFNAIEHVGSTSIPGLAAKPVIDIAIDLNTYPLPEEAIRTMEALGYEYKGEYGIEGREYFVRTSPRAYHVHSYCPGNPEWDAHILFRDYLRANPEAARAYEQLKRELAIRHTNSNAYSVDKTDFVLGTLAKAREWRAEKEQQ